MVCTVTAFVIPPTYFHFFRFHSARKKVMATLMVDSTGGEHRRNSSPWKKFARVHREIVNFFRTGWNNRGIVALVNLLAKGKIERSTFIFLLFVNLLILLLFFFTIIGTGKPNTRTESNREFRVIFLEEITKNVVEGGTRRCSWFPSLFLHGSDRFRFIPLVPFLPLLLFLPLSPSHSLSLFIFLPLQPTTFFPTVKIV